MQGQENEKIKNIRQKLFYNQFGEEIGNYFILKLARALAGDAQKNCLFGIGEGNTGKVLFSTVDASAGDFYTIVLEMTKHYVNPYQTQANP